MNNLLTKLPSFSPDYSGFCSALFSLNGMIVIHDASGCTGNYTAYDEPRWYGSSTRMYSSGLNEINAIIGDDEHLVNKICNAIDKNEINFIAIIGSPVPTVIGTDFRAIGHIIEKKTGYKVLTFDANGIDYYDTGESAAFLAIAQNFVKPPDSIERNAINIIGATPLNIGYRQEEELSALFTSLGYTILSCWGGDSSFDKIAISANASINVVVSQSGIKAARYLESMYGVPYIVGIPIGETSVDRYKKNMEAIIDEKSSHIRDSNSKPSNRCETSVACIIAEQVMGNSLRECLIDEMKFARVIVCSFFEMEPSQSQSGDFHLQSEDDLKAVISSNIFDVVICDPLFKPLIKDIPIISFPHIAISSRLFWDKPVSYLGCNGSRFFHQFLNTAHIEKP